MGIKWFVIVKEIHKYKMLENRGLRSIFVPHREE
jgi:hypothetical protein